MDGSQDVHPAAQVLFVLAGIALVPVILLALIPYGLMSIGQRLNYKLLGVWLDL